MDYYGTTLATASSDHSVKIFDVRNKKQVLIAHLRDHQGPVWSLSWSHPMYGSLLASCGYDRKVIIWQEINGRWGKVFEYAEHASSALSLVLQSHPPFVFYLLVNCVCWAPHSYGLMLACASSDGTISILISDETNSWRAFRIPEAHSVSGSISFDRIMKTSTFDGKHGIHWTARNQPEDLDFAENQALLSHTQEQMQVKSTSVVAASASVGLNIHK
ncbi:unnamed protein product [Schistosoma mattheei]|uniref:Protein SEC13 homolog n=1 Tax=Schistosoma mattheei TaxID=31246 RepID=A0A3P8FDM9_9TREM|nr:unnamed protein product [Schistosoma mattheei]